MIGHPPSPEPPESRQVRRKRLTAPAPPKEPYLPAGEAPAVPEEEFYLSEADVARLRELFLAKPRYPVSTTLPMSVYLMLQRHPKGVSGAFEEAILTFNGDLEALLKAAAESLEQLRASAPQDPKHPVSARIGEEPFQRLDKIEKALSQIRGASRARILAGLAYLFKDQTKG